MDENNEGLTTEQIIAKRRAALFNVKVRNMNVRDFFKFDIKQQRELEDERNKLAVILMARGIKNVDDFLLPIKMKREEEVL